MAKNSVVGSPNSLGRATYKVLGAGNVRELRSFVEKACLEALFAAEREKDMYDVIRLTDELFLKQFSSETSGRQSANLFPVSGSLPTFMPGEKMEKYLEKIETHLLKTALDTHNNNQTRAARELGISRSG